MMIMRMWNWKICDMDIQLQYGKYGEGGGYNVYKYALSSWPMLIMYSTYIVCIYVCM